MPCLIGCVGKVMIQSLLALPLSSHQLTEPPSQQLSLVLQFDGCYRPPRDSGFPTPPRRLAACSACIGIVRPPCTSNDNGNTNTGDDERGDETVYGMMDVLPVAVGAKLLDVPIGMTSQHAEYEGLLMGLEWLSSYFESNVIDQWDEGNSNRCVLDLTDDPSFRSSYPQHVSITVQGDCKTVMDQISGKSVPRKLQRLHERSLHLLARLGKSVYNIGNGTTRSANLQYEHIPRLQNVISDNVCNNLIDVVASQTWKNCVAELDSEKALLLASKNSTRGSSCVEIPAAIDSRNTKFIFEKYLDADSSIIKYSIRPRLYERFETLASLSGDFRLLVAIGQRLVEEASYRHHNDRHHYRVSRFAKRGVELQILGWAGMGQDKKVTLLQRQYDTLLRLTTQAGEIPSDARIAGGAVVFHGDPSLAVEEWDTERIPRRWVSPLLHDWFLAAQGTAWNEGGDSVWVRIRHPERLDM